MGGTVPKNGGFVIDNPLRWMMTGGTPILGNIQIEGSNIKQLGDDTITKKT